MNLHLPNIITNYCNPSQAYIYEHSDYGDELVGIINFELATVIIHNSNCDDFDKFELCLALADDTDITGFLEIHGYIGPDSSEFRDRFHALYSFNFRVTGKYEIHLMGDNLVIDAFNNEQEAEDRASYLTETDPDGDKYEVIVRGNPYERYNN